jgi:hypothetical protein
MLNRLVDLQGGRVDPALSYVDVLKTATEVTIVLRDPLQQPIDD